MIKAQTPAVDTNVSSVLAALPVITSKGAKGAESKGQLYFYSNSHHAAAVSKVGKSGDDKLHTSECPTNTDVNVIDCSSFIHRYTN